MKLIKGALCFALSSILIACGGGSSGYYDEYNSTENHNDNSQLIAAETLLNTLKIEGRYLFGHYDPNDASIAKGYIDHALDTFAQGPLQLAIDAKKLFDQDRSKFSYSAKCMTEGYYSNSGCYILTNDQIQTALHQLYPEKYSDWKFGIDETDLKNLKLDQDQIKAFTGEAIIFIFDNQNKDKQFNDIWVTGVFSYPYQQSWGLTQSQQQRIVSMNDEDSVYKVTVNYSDKESITHGALSVYKDPTSLDGEFYVLQNNSSFSVLTNDNPNTPEVEIVNFTINSMPGNTISSYRKLNNDNQILNLASVSSIAGQRIENEMPSNNTQSFTGSIYLEGNNIFTFKQATNGSILKFKHVLNGTTFEGQSLNHNGTIQTTLTSPSGLTY